MCILLTADVSLPRFPISSQEIQLIGYETYTFRHSRKGVAASRFVGLSNIFGEFLY